MDNEGNVISTEVIKPPANKLEEIAAKLGILKRANTVNSMGYQIAAKRFTGSTVLPVQWVAALDSADIWQFRSAEATVYSNNVVLSNPVNTWAFGGTVGYYTRIAAATSTDESQIVSTIGSPGSNLDIAVTQGAVWVEIEYDFS